MSTGATAFLRKHAGNNKGKIAAIGGVSTATLVIGFQLFASKSSSEAQWLEIGRLRQQVNEQGKTIAQVESLLVYIVQGQIRLSTTNQNQMPQ